MLEEFIPFGIGNAEVEFHARVIRKREYNNIENKANDLEMLT
jgi:hypothetical protein